MMRWFRRKPAEPVFSLTPQTPGEALDAALTEQRQTEIGIENDLLGDLMGEIEALKQRVAALEDANQA